MANDIDARAGAFNCRTVSNVRSNELEILSNILKHSDLAAGVCIQDADSVTACEKGTDERTTEETCSAGDQVAFYHSAVRKKASYQNEPGWWVHPELQTTMQ